MFRPDPYRSAASPVRRLWLARAASAAIVIGLPRLAEPAAAQPAAGSVGAAELKHAAERAELCSAANATGTGLRGEYFARDPKANAPVLVRVDATLDFDPLLEWPAALANQRPGRARWTGWVRPPIGGRYRFHVDQPDTRVVVARQVLVGEGAASDATIELAAGRFFPITVEARRLDEISGRLQLEWTAPYGARYVVPRALLFVPSDTAPASRS
jgi:hypothetical protein